MVSTMDMSCTNTVKMSILTKIDSKTLTYFVYFLFFLLSYVDMYFV